MNAIEAKHLAKMMNAQREFLYQTSIRHMSLSEQRNEVMESIYNLIYNNAKKGQFITYWSTSKTDADTLKKIKEELSKNDYKTHISVMGVLATITIDWE